MSRTLHFHDLGSYHRWLAFGHIHNKFHGKARIMIRGKSHAVVHKTHHEANEIHEYKENGVNRTIRLGRGAIVAYGAGRIKTGKGNNVKRPRVSNNLGMNIRIPRIF